MAENFVNIIRDIRGSTNDPATDTSCIYGDIKSMHKKYQGFKQITDEERLKLENIEEGATKNSTDKFLLSRENHTGNMSIANVQDTPSRMAMTIHEKNKLEAINVNATMNDTDANLRNRATHTGTQSIDTITDTSTHVKMSVTERSKLSGIATDATKNATDAELRSRSTHTGTQSADSIVDGLVNAAYTIQEKNKLSVLSTTVPPAHTHDNTSIINLSYSKLINVPETFYPSKHLHGMNEITTGNLDATRINQTDSMQFVNILEKEKIANAESMNNKGTPFGYVPLDGNGKINPSYLDALNVIDVFTPINQEAMLLLTSAKPGDIAYVQDSQNAYMLVALPVHLVNNWKQMNSGSGVITFNGLNGVVNVGTDEIPEGSANVYFTNERVDDRVANLLAPGTNVSIAYNDDTNQIIISANDTSAEWSEIQNKPNTKIDVSLSGDISGSGSVTLSQLGNGTLNIDNITLESTGTAGTYTKVTTNAKGQVVAGTALSASDIPNLDASKITSGIIDSARLPSFVDDVLEFTNLAGFPEAGETGKIYIAMDTNKTYRWSGSTYVYITSGAVDSVAGKTGVVTLAKSDVGLSNVDNTSDLNKPISTATQNALNTKVDTTTNQTIAGVKTFSSSPIVPTPTAGTHAVNRDYVSKVMASGGRDVYLGSYGLEWNETTDTYRRIGAENYTAIQSLMKRCVLNADGSVKYYLHPDNSNFKEDGTPSILTGADGNVMVEVPKTYVRYEYNTTGGAGTDTVHRWEISLTPDTWFDVHWSFDRGGAIRDKRYYPAYLGYVTGGKMISRSGVYPTVKQTLAQFRTAAKANSVSSPSTGQTANGYWGNIDFALYELIALLAVIEYGTMNIQSALGRGRTALTGGTSVGGELIGVNGLSNEYGNRTASYTYVGASTDANADLSFMSYRGCENFFGNVWRMTDGVIFKGTTPNKTMWYSTNPTGYNETGTGYVNSGVVTASSPGYGRKLANTNKGFIVSDATGGNSNAGTTAHYYTSATDNTVALVGTHSITPLAAGPLGLNAAVSAASFSSSDVGCGVSF